MSGTSAPADGERLRCRIRLADGRMFAGALPPERHRSLHLGLLHGDSDGLVELTPGTRHTDGRLDVNRRNRTEHYLPGGGTGTDGWLEALLDHTARIVAGDYARHRTGAPREEAFVGVAPRTRPRGGKDSVAQTHFLWVDVDRPGELHRLWALLAERPCHCLVETAGSGGVHAYWRLSEPLPATQVDERTGELIEPIERANLRLIHRLGTGADGRPNVADPACRERARILRLAGSINWKTGRFARIIEADFGLPGYTLGDLVGDLPDPPSAPAVPPARRAVDHADAYKRISPIEYAELLGGLTPDRGGYVRCPMTGHEDRHPSAHVGRTAEEGWYCFSCGTGGAIYDFASALLGGPIGRELRGDAFLRAKAYIADVFGELT
jgi:hypothetical protein